jgi:hypothetical protein
VDSEQFLAWLAQNMQVWALQKHLKGSSQEVKPPPRYLGGNLIFRLTFFKVWPHSGGLLAKRSAGARLPKTMSTSMTVTVAKASASKEQVNDGYIP